jgi:hypothetical protein
MPYQRLAGVILDEWRTLELHRAMVASGSAEAALFQAAADVLRDEYGHLIDEASAHGRPVPPPFPGTLPTSMPTSPPGSSLAAHSKSRACSPAGSAKDHDQ